MNYRPFNAEERRALAALRTLGLNQAEIARELGRQRSTVGRELQAGSALRGLGGFFRRGRDGTAVHPAARAFLGLDPALLEKGLVVAVRRAAGEEQGEGEEGEWFHQLVLSTAMKASCGMFTRPMDFMRFFPSFCFSKSLRFRLMSPP